MKVLITVVALVAAAILLDYYFRRAARSHQAAVFVWGMLNEAANDVLRGGYPAPIRRLAIDLVLSAGCGCYVRQLLLGRWLPRIARLRLSGAETEAANAETKDAMHGLSEEQRATVGMLFAATIMYDGFANPFWGWVFRRSVPRFAAWAPTRRQLPKPELDQRRTATAVARREEKHHGQELCAA